MRQMPRLRLRTLQLLFIRQRAGAVERDRPLVVSWEAVGFSMKSANRLLHQRDTDLLKSMQAGDVANARRRTREVSAPIGESASMSG